jgi:superfamily II DNA or RNA helicase
MNRELGSYFDIDSPEFYSSINRKKEFVDNSQSSHRTKAECFQPHQRFVANFVNPLTQYNSLLINHQPGLGKTLSSIGIAENFKKDYKIIIFVKNKILEINYRKELLGNCSGYVTQEERKILNTVPSKSDFDAIENKEKLIKKIETNINKVYSFYTYGSLVSDNAFNKPKNFNNSVVIFDEIHNAIGNNYYNEIIKIMKKSSNFKTILLTATPIFESVSEIFEISNLLNTGHTNKILPIRGDLILAKMIIKSPKTKGSFLNDSVSKITSLGKEALKDTLRGKVSYLDIDETKSSFATKEFVGTPISKPGYSLNVFESKMTPLQYNSYVKSLEHSKQTSSTKENNVLFKDSSDISTVVFPDGSFGIKGYQKHIKSKGENTLLQLSNLQKFSPKLYSIIKIVKTSPGLIFLYSNYVNYGGTELLAAALKENGYTNYFSRSNTPKFVVLGDIPTDKGRQKIINIFNGKENIHGKDIKIIIGSPSVSEGVSFKNIRSIHILEPHWNLSRIDQIIGRGIRYRSHSDLPQSERNVKIYLHACIHKKEDSIDFLKYSLSEKKDIASKEITNLLREISVDCNLNKKTTRVSSQKDFTRNCNYTKCNYICPGSNNSSTIDTDTYSVKIHSPGEYSFILKTVRDLFSSGFVYTYDFIEKFILKKDPLVNKENIKYLLAEYTGSQDIFKNPNNVSGTLLNINGIYFINPDDNPIDESFFYKMFKKEIKNKSIPVPIKKNKNKEAVKKEEQIVDTDQAVYGTKIGDTFRIVIKEEVSPRKNSKIDKRVIKTGKDCRSYTKEQLKGFLVKFGLNVKKITKENICEAIERYMSTNGLLYK